MQRQGGGAVARRAAASIASVLVMTVLLAPATRAADEVAGRNVGHTQKVEWIEVGDVPGHLLGVSQSSGLAFYSKGADKGEIAVRMYTTIFDLVKGRGTFSGHEVKTFKDGSTLIVTYRGAQTPLDGGKRTGYEGTWEVSGGTGRYAGARGSGTFNGERIGDLKTGGDSYTDFIGTVTKE